MNRKTFFRHSFALALGLGASTLRPWAVRASRTKTYNLTLLHTTDLGGHVDSSGSEMDLARLKTLIEKGRSTAAQSLLLDTGNALGSTAYSEMYGPGFYYELMSKLDYDAALVGPHDWEKGLAKLGQAFEKAAFPLLCSNYAFDETALKEQVHAHRMFQAGEVKVGFFGVNPEVLAWPVPDRGKIRFRDPVLIARAMVRSLKGYYACDLAVCLSQLGAEADRKLAQAASGIDVILGKGSPDEDGNPESIAHENGRQTLINRAAGGGKELGRLDLVLDKRKKIRH